MKKAVVFFVLMMAVLGSCNRAQAQQSKLIGKWVGKAGSNFNGTTPYFEFTETIYVSFFSNLMDVKYKIENGAIKSSGDSEIFANSFEFVDNGTLKFIGGSFDGLTFKRVVKPRNISQTQQSRLIGKWVTGGKIGPGFNYLEFTETSFNIGGSADYKIENGAIIVSIDGNDQIIDSFEFVDNDTLKFIVGNNEQILKRVK